MSSDSQPNFITLDLDIVSKEDLSPLAKYFEEDGFVLGHQKVEELHYLSIEPCWFSEEENTPKNCISFFVNRISGFSEELNGLWLGASSKILNLGFDSGINPPPYRSDITNEILGKIAELDLSLRITIYQCESPPSESEQNEIRT